MVTVYGCHFDRDGTNGLGIVWHPPLANHCSCMDAYALFYRELKRALERLVEELAKKGFVKEFKNLGTFR